MSPIFGIPGERLCGVRGFTTEAIAVAMAAGGKFSYTVQDPARNPIGISRENSNYP
jgi:hypothetical protein